VVGARLDGARVDVLASEDVADVLGGALAGASAEGDGLDLAAVLHEGVLLGTVF
jgi:hypothetical protein